MDAKEDVEYGGGVPSVWLESAAQVERGVPQCEACAGCCRHILPGCRVYGLPRLWRNIHCLGPADLRSAARGCAGPVPSGTDPQVCL